MNNIIKRVYYLDNKETDLGAILEQLEYMLRYSGSTSEWEELGISFEDKEVENNVNG